jgi:hypothetical protein
MEFVVIAKREHGIIEVECKAGIIDVLTGSEIIEVKSIKRWRNAIGQVISYVMCHPDKQPRIHLFNPSGCLTEDMLLDIIPVCVYANVRLTVEMDPKVIEKYRNLPKKIVNDINTEFDITKFKRESDGFYNAGKMCTAIGKILKIDKQWAGFRKRNQDTLQAIADNIGRTLDELIKYDRKEQDPRFQGTMVHPRIAKALLLWLHPTLAANVDI